MCYPANKTQVS